jgi:hypothetical protein
VQRIVVGVLESLLEDHTTEATGRAHTKHAAAKDEFTLITREQNAPGRGTLKR